jgi:hypothetical protein
MTRPPCGAELDRGRTCRAFALDSGRCWNHDPARTDERHRARSRGGKLRALQGRRRRLTTPAALLAFVDSLIWDAIAGKYDPKLVNAVVGAVNTQRALIEVGGLQERLEALEALVKDWPVPPAEQRRGRWAR